MQKVVLFPDAPSCVPCEFSETASPKAISETSDSGPGNVEDSLGDWATRRLH